MATKTCDILVASYTRPANTTAYAAGDVIADSTSAATILTFSAAAKSNGWGGVINAATLVDSAAESTKPSIDLYLFDRTVVMENDNAAWDPSDTEAGYLVGVISFDGTSGTNFKTMASGNGAIHVQNIGLPYRCAATDLYGILVARNAYTPISGEVFTVKLHVVKDE